MSQLEKDWLLRVETVLSKLLYVAKAEDVKEIFEELKEVINELDKDKKEKFYSYLKSLLIGSGSSAKEATETVQEFEEEGEGEGTIKILEKERKKGKLEGRLEEKRNDIYEILEARFGNVPEDIKEVVEKISDLKKLSELLKKVFLLRILMSLENT